MNSNANNHPKNTKASKGSHFSIQEASNSTNAKENPILELFPPVSELSNEEVLKIISLNDNCCINKNCFFKAIDDNINFDINHFIFSDSDVSVRNKINDQKREEQFWLFKIQIISHFKDDS
jgi:hypothetical protein